MCRVLHNSPFVEIWSRKIINWTFAKLDFSVVVNSILGLNIIYMAILFQNGINISRSLYCVVFLIYFLRTLLKMVKVFWIDFSKNGFKNCKIW